MLTKDQREVIELKYIRIIEAFEIAFNNFVNAGMRGKIDDTKMKTRKNEFFAYLDILTEK